MIKGIINIFGEQARQHKAIKSFRYDRTYEMGGGKDMYPLFWLEDPITGDNQGNIFTNSVNFSILFVPKSGESITDYQSLAFSTGLNILERIKADPTSEISIKPDWTYVTLRNYYDDNACGCRFSVNFTQRNMQNLCLIDEQFDMDKEFENEKSLPDFSINPADNCQTFVNGFPVFDLKTRK